MKRLLVLLRVLALHASVWCADASLFTFAQLSGTHLHDDAWIAQQKAKGVKNAYRNYFTTPGRFTTAVRLCAAPPSVSCAVTPSPVRAT